VSLVRLAAGLLCMATVPATLFILAAWTRRRSKS
jgi:hypothetical protein